MPIKELNEVQLSEILNKHFTPSKEIITPERLFGREVHLRQIGRAFNSEGRNVFIFGDRGIGKTSLARTAAKVNNFQEENYIYVPCGEFSRFGDIMEAVARSAIPITELVSKSKGSGGLNVGYAGASLGINFSNDNEINVPKPKTVIEALDILSLVDNKRNGRTIVVIDEFDRLISNEEKNLFAELIKNISTRDLDLRFIFCGIGQTVDEILGAHLSAGRYFEPIELEKLHHNFLWDIIKTVAHATNVEIPEETLIRIGIVSDGFPHFVHLIGECLFWAMHDDDNIVSVCSRVHYETAIKQALIKTEPTLRLAYQKATEKTKNHLEYEEALWALADRSDTRRQITTIYEKSYRRIIQQRSLVERQPLSKEQLNHRLLALRKHTHGNVVVGYGSGWFSFRENVLRGYVRLKAETEGIELTPDPA